MKSMVSQRSVGSNLLLTHRVTADIQEYLLKKGVEAVAIHGSKTQEEREYAIRSFKEGKKDVMVASGVASKVRPSPAQFLVGRS